MMAVAETSNAAMGIFCQASSGHQANPLRAASAIQIATLLLAASTSGVRRLRCGAGNAAHASQLKSSTAAGATTFPNKICSSNTVLLQLLVEGDSQYRDAGGAMCNAAVDHGLDCFAERHYYMLDKFCSFGIGFVEGEFLSQIDFHW